MKEKALLLGGTGFAGRHMRRLLQSHYDVAATGTEVDIRDSKQVKDLVANANPDIVVNFSAITTVQESIDRFLENYQISFFGTLNLLMALKENAFKGRLLNISSSEVYGYPEKGELPLTEDSAIRPMNPYAVGKAAAELLCYQWSQTESFDVVIARPFTHIGPGQSDRFAIASFARKIAEIVLGRHEPTIKVGNLANERDFNDVRDVVRAYESVLIKGQNGHVYNICSGKETSAKAMLDQLISLSGIKIKVFQERSLRRKNEASTIRGSNEKLRDETGWKPEIPVETTLKDTLDYWVEKIKKS